MDILSKDHYAARKSLLDDFVFSKVNYIMQTQKSCSIAPTDAYREYKGNFNKMLDSALSKELTALNLKYGLQFCYLDKAVNEKDKKNIFAKSYQFSKAVLTKLDDRYAVIEINSIDKFVGVALYGLNEYVEKEYGISNCNIGILKLTSNK